MTRSRRMRQVEHAANMQGIRNEMSTAVCPEDLKERDPLEELCADGRIMLKWFLGNTVKGCGFMWLRAGTEAGSSKHGHEPSGPITAGKLSTS
jgi:hypothetical protein